LVISSVEELVWVYTAYGGVEQLDHVEGRNFGLVSPSQAAHQLQQATRVG
jgi:hypothetical protein